MSAASGAPRVYSVEQVCDALNICRATFYKLVGEGKLVASKIGGRRVVSDARLREFLAAAEVKS